jgi:hypothetical protein
MEPWAAAIAMGEGDHMQPGKLLYGPICFQSKKNPPGKQIRKSGGSFG